MTKLSGKFLISHVFTTILFINASICHFCYLLSICHAVIFTGIYWPYNTCPNPGLILSIFKKKKKNIAYFGGLIIL